MELNHPGGDPNSPFYVTNGLLTVELVTGRLQVGDNRFIPRYPAAIPLASDETQKMLKAYGVWGEKSMYGKTFMG